MGREGDKGWAGDRRRELQRECGQPDLSCSTSGTARVRDRAHRRRALIPLSELPGRLRELMAREIVTHCHHGVRSLQALALLKAGRERAELAGGIDAWSVPSIRSTALLNCRRGLEPHGLRPLAPEAARLPVPPLRRYLANGKSRALYNPKSTHILPSTSWTKSPSQEPAWPARLHLATGRPDWCDGTR